MVSSLRKDYRALFAPDERAMHEAYQKFVKEARALMHAHGEKNIVFVSCRFSLSALKYHKNCKGGAWYETLKKEPIFAVGPTGTLMLTQWTGAGDPYCHREELIITANLSNSTSSKRSRFRIFELYEILERLDRGEYVREPITIVDNLTFVGDMKIGV